MKKLTAFKTILSIVTLMILSPITLMAAPVDPGDDPFAVPVNGYIAAVAVVAFLYGAYRIYSIAKRNGLDNTKF